MHVILRSKPFVGSIIITVFIIYGSIKPDSGGDSFLGFFNIPNIDKLLHLLFYLVLSLSMFYGFTRKTLRVNPKVIYGISLGYPFLLGAVLEWVQWNFIPSRNGEWLDLLSNTTGILLALMLFYLYTRIRFNRS